MRRVSRCRRVALRSTFVEQGNRLLISPLPKTIALWSSLRVWYVDSSCSSLTVRKAQNARRQRADVQRLCERLKTRPGSDARTHRLRHFREKVWFEKIEISRGTNSNFQTDPLQSAPAASAPPRPAPARPRPGPMAVTCKWREIIARQSA
jgi:hypothetical protein